jgi:hypothetical protein
MKFIRQVGIGDVGHVRSQLLSVAILTTHLGSDQLAGAIEAAEVLGMRLRAQQLVEDALHETTLNNMICRNMAADHQLLTYYGSVPDEVIATCELILQPEGNEAYISDETKQCIIKTWQHYGGRFAGGNFAKHDAATLKRMYIDANPL